MIVIIFIVVIVIIITINNNFIIILVTIAIIFTVKIIFPNRKNKSNQNYIDCNKVSEIWSSIAAIVENKKINT